LASPFINQIPCPDSRLLLDGPSQAFVLRMDYLRQIEEDIRGLGAEAKK